MTKSDFKRPRRIVDKRAGYTKLLREGRCRACGQTFPLNRHHLINRSQGGDDLDVNIVPLCGSGTSGCHGAFTTHSFITDPSHLKGLDWTVVALRLRESLKQAEINYILDTKGEEWLQRTYPS